MSEVRQTPSQVLLSGEGLSSMLPSQYDTFVKQLARMGINATIYQETESDPELITTSRADFLKWGDEKGYSESLVNRVWRGLQVAYTDSRDYHDSAQEAGEDDIDPDRFDKEMHKESP
ncbi:MAG: hypothetical protein ACREHG_11475, partial [Candidatus Saccharimonadales bacterium]